MNYLIEAENIVKSLENELETLSAQYSELMEKYEILSREYMILSQVRMTDILTMERLESSVNETKSLEASALVQVKQLNDQNSKLSELNKALTDRLERLEQQINTSSIVSTKQKEVISNLEQQLKRLTKR